MTSTPSSSNTPTTTTPVDAGFVTDAVARLEEQAAVGHRLAELARSQRELIDSGDAEALINVLHERQAGIHELLDVVELLGPLTEATQHSPEVLSPVQRGHVQELVDSISHDLAEIIDIDTADRAPAWEERLRDLSRDRNVNDTARVARKAYGRAEPEVGPLAGATNRYTDQHG